MTISQHIKAIALIFLTVFPFLATAEQVRVPHFRDYPVSSTYIGKSAKVVLSTADEKAFRTRLREASKQPVNFAGEYVLTLGLRNKLYRRRCS